MERLSALDEPRPIATSSWQSCREVADRRLRGKCGLSCRKKKSWNCGGPLPRAVRWIKPGIATSRLAFIERGQAVLQQRRSSIKAQLIQEQPLDVIDVLQEKIGSMIDCWGGGLDVRHHLRLEHPDGIIEREKTPPPQQSSNAHMRFELISLMAASMTSCVSNSTPNIRNELP